MEGCPRPHLQRDLRPPRLGHWTPLFSMASPTGWFAKSVTTCPPPSQPLPFCQHLCGLTSSLRSSANLWPGALYLHHSSGDIFISLGSGEAETWPEVSELDSTARCPHLIPTLFRVFSRPWLLLRQQTPQSVSSSSVWSLCLDGEKGVLWAERCSHFPLNKSKTWPTPLLASSCCPRVKSPLSPAARGVYTAMAHCSLHTGTEHSTHFTPDCLSPRGAVTYFPISRGTCGHLCASYCKHLG